MPPVTVTLLGSGGVAHTFDLPLSEPFADQLAKGALVPASEDDEATLADFAAGLAASDPPDEGGRPGGLSASKAAWVAYAVAQGMDPAAAKKASKADLVALFLIPEPDPEPEPTPDPGPSSEPASEDDEATLADPTAST